VATRIVEIRQNILNKNDLLARQLRERFTAAGVFTVNLVSSPGSGKTAFLQRTLTGLLARGSRAAALVGDLETDNDARRLAASGAPVRQINTHGRCHLEAGMIESHLDGWNPAEFEFLFIENVGNLVCPSSYDLGESLRVVMLSVTEGEDKPLKYPGIFHSADLTVITKHDLAAACELDRGALLANLEAVCPGRPVLFTSARSGEGFPEWLALLDERRAGRLAATGSS
jgi:hydrogenase nickel incorporation protein HypB